MVRLCIVVPAADQVSANAWMKAYVDPVGGEFTFTAPLYTPGPAYTLTYFWCYGFFEDEVVQAIKDEFLLCYDDTMLPYEIMTGLGVSPDNGES